MFLCAGELDGGGISYLRREWEETQDLTQEKQLLTKTILVPQVRTQFFFYRYGDNAVDKWRLSRDNIDKERLILSWYTRRMCTI